MNFRRFHNNFRAKFSKIGENLITIWSGKQKRPQRASNILYGHQIFRNYETTPFQKKILKVPGASILNENYNFNKKNESKFNLKFKSLLETPTNTGV